MDTKANVPNDVIDLTEDDYVPPPKKIATGSGESISVVDDRPGISQVINGTQRLNGAIRKRGNCSVCERASCTLLQNCHHRLCFNHVHEIINKQSPFVMCPVPDCNEEISAHHIRSLLSPNDYTEFLEDKLKYCQQIFRGLNDHTDKNKSGAKSSSQNGKTKQIIPEVDDDSDDIIMKESTPPLVKPPVRRDSGLYRLAAQNLVPNYEAFECQVCCADYEVGEGIILKNCFHCFCEECLIQAITHSEVPEVKCPHFTCEYKLEEREVRALAPLEVYTQHLDRALKQAEAILENIFHCKTLDCRGFVEFNPQSAFFPCPICDTVNCLKCQAVHEAKTCEQYQEDLKLDEMNNQNNQLTQKAIDEMLQEGKVNWRTRKFPCVLSLNFILGNALSHVQHRD